MKNWIKYLISGVVIVGIISCSALSAITIKAVNAVKEDVNKISDGEKDVARENNVKIADEYYIRSTTDISDAYKSGNSSKLDDKKKETLKMASDVLKKIIKKDMTDYEKELAVYKWMTTSLQNDVNLLLVIPNTGKDSDNPYGVLKYHDAVCVGYATTFRLFMQMMGIKCMVVHNTTMYHSWDLVQLDGDWYHTDIYSDQEAGNYAHFNITDSQCSKDNDWNTDFFPSANGTKYSYAYQNIKTISDIYALPKEIKSALDKKQSAFFFDFKSKIDEKQATVAETLMNNISTCFLDTQKYSNYSLSWNWSSADGRYYICIYVDGMQTKEKKVSKKELNKISNSISKAFDLDGFEASENTDNDDMEVAG